MVLVGLLSSLGYSAILVWVMPPRRLRSAIYYCIQGAWLDLTVGCGAPVKIEALLYPRYH